MSFKKIPPFLFSLIAFMSLPNTYAASKPDTKKSETAIQNAILVHINEYRKNHRLPPLTMDNHIINEARQHSLDMATHRMPFGHKNFTKRITNLRKQIKNAGAGAENVAYNYKDARTVVQQWVRSSGHRRNIVGNYNLTGIGVVRDKHGKLYFTQIFLRTHEGNSKTHATRRPPFGVSFGGISFRKNA